MLSVPIRKGYAVVHFTLADRCVFVYAPPVERQNISLNSLWAFAPILRAWLYP